MEFKSEKKNAKFQEVNKIHCLGKNNIHTYINKIFGTSFA